MGKKTLKKKQKDARTCERVIIKKTKQTKYAVGTTDSRQRKKIRSKWKEN